MEEQLERYNDLKDLIDQIKSLFEFMPKQEAEDSLKYLREEIKKIEEENRQAKVSRIG